MVYSVIVFRVADYMKTIEKLYYQYPKICKIWLGPNKTYCLLSDPEYIKIVLTNPKAIDKSDVYETITEVFGPGILTAPGI